jgi:hypothetical protein
MAQPPWTHSTALGGEFYYNPRTDEIVMKTGQHFARPRQMPADALRASSYDGGSQSLPFQYGGSPPGPANSFSIAGGRQQVLPNRPGPSGSGGLPQGAPGRPPAGMNPTRPGQLRSTQQIPADRELQVVFNARTGSQIERREPVRNQAPARNVPGISIGDEGVTSTLFPDFRLRPASFFSLGRVFMVLWSEPAGGGSTVTKWEPGITLNRYNERVYSKVRRFVVVRPGQGGATFCTALPGAKAGVNKSEHCIIYTTRVAPTPRQNELPTRRGEDSMQQVPIRVDPDSPTAPLDEMSRLNLAGVTTVQHNIKVRSFGKVNDRSVRDLLTQFDLVWGRQPFPAPPRAPIVNPIPGYPERPDDEESGEDDDDDDEEEEDDDDEEESE